jgi:hypothetical protein
MELEKIHASALGQVAPFLRDLLKCMRWQPFRHGEAVSDRGLRSVIVSGSTRNQRLLLTAIRCAGLRAESPPTS